MALLPSHSGWSWREFIYVFVEVSSAPALSWSNWGRPGGRDWKEFYFLRPAKCSSNRQNLVPSLSCVPALLWGGQGWSQGAVQSWVFLGGVTQNQGCPSTP